MTACTLTPLSLEPAALVAAWQDARHLLWLDSADEKHPEGKWSYVMADPAEWIESRGERITITDENGTRVMSGNPFDVLRERLQKARPSTHGPAPFTGGLAGFFGYDLARTLETLPRAARKNPDMPDMAVGVYTKVYAYNHAQKQGRLIGAEAPAPKALSADMKPLNWQATLSPETYQSRVQQVIDYIKAGDIFQANLSQRFEAALPEGFDPLVHYLSLRTANPAPFGGYFDAGALQISSCSPERFLSLSEGRTQTNPIKGTAPRSADPAQDKRNAEGLKASLKDRAENIMIVDLLRNDLSKVCTPESVTVESLCALESFAKVHHLVSTVSGVLSQGRDALDLLKACFTGGSITGAPKIRAMEIIEELEDMRRGPYTGALGWIGFDGAMDTNILIRSLVYANGTASLNVGGGITARSEPEAEYTETLDKAAGMRR
jgi:para-aminobenzoate synthetase component 1